MYLLIFMPKNLVVTNCPLSPYQPGVDERWIALNEPADACPCLRRRRCRHPARMALADCWMMRTGGTRVEHVDERDAGKAIRLVSGSSGHLPATAEGALDVAPCTPASAKASSTASAPISNADLSRVAEGVEATR